MTPSEHKAMVALLRTLRGPVVASRQAAGGVPGRALRRAMEREARRRAKR